MRNAFESGVLFIPNPMISRWASLIDSGHGCSMEEHFPDLSCFLMLTAGENFFSIWIFQCRKLPYFHQLFQTKYKIRHRLSFALSSFLCICCDNQLIRRVRLESQKHSQGRHLWQWRVYRSKVAHWRATLNGIVSLKDNNEIRLSSLCFPIENCLNPFSWDYLRATSHSSCLNQCSCILGFNPATSVWSGESLYCSKGLSTLQVMKIYKNVFSCPITISLLQIRANRA